MRAAVAFAVCASVLLVAGCSTRSGKFLGIIPVSKPYEGEAQGGKYTAQDELFSVSVPYAVDSYEYKKMKVRMTSHRWPAP